MLRYETETRPGLVALYDIRPGNGAGPFLQPRSPHGALNSLKSFVFRHCWLGYRKGIRAACWFVCGEDLTGAWTIRQPPSLSLVSFTQPDKCLFHKLYYFLYFTSYCANIQERRLCVFRDGTRDFPSVLETFAAIDSRLAMPVRDSGSELCYHFCSTLLAATWWVCSSSKFF